MKFSLPYLAAIVFVLLPSVHLCAALSVTVDSTAFVTNQILSCPTDTSITVRIVPKKILQVYYEYGVTRQTYQRQTPIVTTSVGVPLKVDLLGLAPNTRYYYRIRFKLPSGSTYSAGDECTFTTQRAKGKPFSFTLTGDSHLYDKKGISAMMKVTMENIAADAPDFDMEMGDTFGDDHTPLTTTQLAMNQLHLDYMPYIGIACHSTAFFLTIGNHEGESGYYLLQTPPQNIAVYGTLARKYYYSLPSPNGFYSGDTTTEGYGMGRPENYYAWEWGDAMFVVLDVYRYSTASDSPGQWDWTLGSQQYAWLKRTLEKSTAKFKFVFAHHTRGYGRGGTATAKYFEWGGYENNGTTWGFTVNRPGWALPIHQLMVQNHVNIFFQGHDHLFAVEKLDGIVYQEIPMPSDSTYMIGYLANADAYTGVTLSGTGHVRVTVTPDSAVVDYVAAYLPRDVNAQHINGAVVYSYAVKPTVTSVAAEQPRPSDFGLEQNYPNPFNPSTTIKFQIPASAFGGTAGNAGYVSLKVYDMLGREAAVLVSESRSAGVYSQVWDASGFPSGMYFYVLRAGSMSLSRRCIIVK